jgi:hypothetical protein
MQLHKLTRKQPEAIYLNIEQSPKFRADDGELLQENIDKAFQTGPRMTTNSTTCRDQKIFLINGKNTDNLGVTEVDFGRAKNCRVTDLERTLIDITVNPHHSGGVSEVLHAYKAARNKISASKLAGYLKKIDHKYPYHQAIGFYMQRAGYDVDAVKLMWQSRPIEVDFYLAHRMERKDYSQEWRVYFPKGL